MVDESVLSFLDRARDEEALVSALANSPRPVAFMVGSALSMPSVPGGPGIPDVTGIVELARAEVASRDGDLVTRFDTTVNGDEGQARERPAGARYQAAMAFLLDYFSQDLINDVVQQAVRRARRAGTSELGRSEEELERDLDGWGVPPGTRALAELLVGTPRQFEGPVLTTNFDPLLSVAVRSAGGRVARTVVDRDRGWGGVREQDGDDHVVEIVHLHGFWRGSDTLHLPFQLSAHRGMLESEVRRLLQGHLVAVVGYGGWDDAFTATLADVAADSYVKLDVVWAFYEHDRHLIKDRYGKLLTVMTPVANIGRFRVYRGIDCNRLFDRLLAVTDRPGVVSPILAHSPSIEDAVPRPEPANHIAEPKPLPVDPSPIDEEIHLPLSPRQRTFATGIVSRIRWLLGDHSSEAESLRSGSCLPTISTVLMRRSKYELVLRDLATIQPDDWPETDWGELGEALDEAEDALEQVTRTPPWLPVGNAYNECEDSIATLHRALARLLDLIVIDFLGTGGRS